MPTPVPIRIQTPELAFVDALQERLVGYQAAGGESNLLLSIVPAEPASDSLLNDLRLRGRRFSGALVPQWLIPDLVRDDFILPVSPPVTLLPESIARLRSFGGQWVASDLDHDCDLLFYRADQLDSAGLAPPETWEDLLTATETLSGSGSGIGLPCTYAQQVADHFCAMAVNFVGTNPFWFDSSSMQPTIDSQQHVDALELWQALAAHVPAALRTGSTGDLWNALIDGSVGFLVASASLLPFALDRIVDPSLIGILPLPGTLSENKTVVRTGNTTGANWGGVAIKGTYGTDAVAGFLDYLTGPNQSSELWSDRSTGILPTPATAIEVARDSATLTSAGWPEAPTNVWLSALQETFGNPNQLIPLRIAETRRYLQALDDLLVRFLTGEISTATETLERAASEWGSINNAIDVEVQRELFEQSLMAPPAQ